MRIPNTTFALFLHVVSFPSYFSNRSVQKGVQLCHGDQLDLKGQNVLSTACSPCRIEKPYTRNIDGFLFLFSRNDNHPPASRSGRRFSRDSTEVRKTFVSYTLMYFIFCSSIKTERASTVSGFGRSCIDNFDTKSVNSCIKSIRYATLSRVAGK